MAIYPLPYTWNQRKRTYQKNRYAGFKEKVLYATEKKP